MTFKRAFIASVVAIVLLTSMTQILGYGAQQAGLLAAAFVLRFLLMVFQETAKNEEYLMFIFVVVALSFGAKLISFNSHWLLLVVNLVCVLLGYYLASYTVRLRGKA